jgi:hypothetical protein
VNNVKHQHNRLCNKLKNILIERDWYDTVDSNLIYGTKSNNIGECDVLAVTHNREVYFEYKCNHTEQGYKKATEQLIRWTKYQYNRDKTKDYYGIYYTGDIDKLEIIAKNGKIRRKK